MYNKINLIEKYKTYWISCVKTRLYVQYLWTFFLDLRRIACEWLRYKLVELFTTTSIFSGDRWGGAVASKKRKYIFFIISLRHIKKRTHLQSGKIESRVQYKHTIQGKENMARIDYYYRSISTSTQTPKLALIFDKLFESKGKLGRALFPYRSNE